MSDLEYIRKIVSKEFKDDPELIRIGGTKSNVKVLSTGSISLDAALGVGGLPKGRIVEIYGPEASGKTTICLGIIAKAQKLGLNCAFIDAEHALDPNLAIGIGVDWDNLLFAQPDYGEQALDVLCKMIETGKLGLGVVDSVAALTPKAELEGDMESVQMGAQARMIGKGLRKIAAAASRSGAIVIFINQLREKLGVMFGNPETTPGGKALKFFSSIRMDVRRKEAITSGTKIIGNDLKVKIIKNKVAPPHAVAEVKLIYGKGIDNTKDVINLAVDYGIIEKRGSSYFFYNDDVKANGMDNFIELAQSFGKVDEIEQKVQKAIQESEPKPVVPEDGPDE